jgi:nickel-dependent lactate racemase
MNLTKGGIVQYVTQGKRLPSKELIRAYLSTIKEFCEDETNVTRNDQATFRGTPAIVFVNKSTKQIVIFTRDEKEFITAYMLNETQFRRYLKSNEVGKED